MNKISPSGRHASVMVFLTLSLLSNQLAAQETEIVQHQVFGHRDGMAMYYDVEIPKDPNSLGIVLIVSGGFVSGEDNLTIMKPFWDMLLDEGYTLFQIYHPAHPSYRIPDAIDALRLGLQNIQTNSDRFDVDNERLGLMGVSSGGFLALLLAMSVEPELRSESDFKAVVAMMPLVDVLDSDFDGELFGARYRDFDPALYASVSPINHVTEDDPPTLLIHGIQDAAVSFERNSVRMREKMDAAGIENELLAVEAGHEVFPEPILSVVRATVIDWFDKHL